MNEFGISTDQLQSTLFIKEQAKKRENVSERYITNDKYSDLRLRLAVINNSTQQNYKNKESLDLTNVYDPIQGKVVIQWMKGNNNGVNAIERLSGTWEYKRENNDYNIKNRKPIYQVDSSMPNVKLTSPFIWTGDNGKSCGINYVPPNNSICIIGNKESTQPLILGYLPSNPAVLYPALKPGEVSISGYGNNFIHWSQSDKITIYCRSNVDEYDKDDKDYIDNRDKCKKNAADCEIEININANDRYIEILSIEKNGNPQNNSRKSKYYQEIDGYERTKIIISPKSMSIESSDDKGNVSLYEQTSKLIHKSVINTNNGKKSEEFITNDSIDIKTTNFNVNAKNINLNERGILKDDVYELDVKKFIVNAEEIEMNSTRETTIHSDDVINITVPIIPEEDHPHIENDFAINISGCHINQTES